MPGYISDAYRNHCTPRDDGGYCDQQQTPDWTWMHGAMGRGIMPTDLDGMIEVRGNFLIIDQKNGPADSRGQGRAYEAMSMMPNFTVMYITPIRNEWSETLQRVVDDVMHVGFVTAGETVWTGPHTVDIVRRMLHNWFETSNSNPWSFR